MTTRTVCGPEAMGGHPHTGDLGIVLAAGLLEFATPFPASRRRRRLHRTGWLLFWVGLVLVLALMWFLPRVVRRRRDDLPEGLTDRFVREQAQMHRHDWWTSGGPG